MNNGEQELQSFHTGVILLILHFNYFFVLANLWRFLFGKVKLQQCMEERWVNIDWTREVLSHFCDHPGMDDQFSCFTWNRVNLKFWLFHKPKTKFECVVRRSLSYISTCFLYGCTSSTNSVFKCFLKVVLKDKAAVSLFCFFGLSLNKPSFRAFEPT